jgi:hypothetical protein
MFLITMAVGIMSASPDGDVVEAAGTLFANLRGTGVGGTVGERTALLPGEADRSVEIDMVAAGCGGRPQGPV